MSAKKPTVALIYDFDGTLSPGNMQEYDFLRSIGVRDKKSFWEENTALAKKNNASEILCYMKLMIDKSKSNNNSIKRKAFVDFGKNIELFEGVVEWFDIINQYGKNKNIKIEHYINSSGLKEMIEGTPIAKEFKEIYACSFLYEDDIAVWPGVAVDFTAKTQFLFMINKGVENVYDNKKVNDSTLEADRPIPFKQMIYFGDGETDIPSMKLVKEHGGNSIAVYKPRDNNKKLIAEKLIVDNRVNFVCSANYSKDKEIYKVVTIIIDKIRSDYEFENLEKQHRKNAI
ncbi:MAG: HAD family hydrolase [Bacteroidales bacterium]